MKVAGGDTLAVFGQGPVGLSATVLGVAMGVFAQVGDLAELLLKRMSGAKDASAIIPGHGGVLDRFDSLYFTAPLLYYYLKMAIFHAY